MSLCGYKVILQNTFLKKKIESDSYKTKAMKPVNSKDRTSIPKVLYFFVLFFASVSLALVFSQVTCRVHLSFLLWMRVAWLGH